ncbi:MAG: GGDEF domain-containing phosphodiesterase, partial [Ketobacteraceae bacterium]|nr:GGDEF domain-containing phosphodiesterase [Ketobacteraceae bacterium]
EAPFVWEAKTYSIGCSIGIVPITANSTDGASLLQAADSACQMAKEQGRNRIVLTHQGDEELAARRNQLEWLGRIRGALKHEKLFLEAQQIVPINRSPSLRVEVLVRMLGDDNQVILPGAFLPAAERFGLAHLLDRWVIKTVCAFLSQNRSAMEYLEACHINISGRSFDHEDFTQFVLNTLANYKVPGNKLCFEITETAAISNLTDVQQFMTTLSEAGASFALADFGVGLSSFAYLKQFPVEYLKIDGSFVRHMAKDKTDRAMVRAINDIGQTLGKQLVAEFVEDQESLEWLKKMGVQYAQGFHLHRPERFEQVLETPAGHASVISESND